VPRITLQLPETRQSVTRPIAYDITRRLGALMQLPAITEILFTGPTDQALQAGSTLNYKGAPSKFPGNSRISVDVNEVIDDANVLAEDSFQENAPTCFLDKGIGVRLRPIYASTLLTLRFDIRSRSRTEAEKIRDEYRLRAAVGRRQILHNLTYHYGIPSDEMDLLNIIYQLRENVAGYGDSFADWMRKSASPRLTQISDLAGTAQSLQWVFGEVQTSVQGMFDFFVQPEAPDKNSDDGTYNFPIEYKIRYDKPVGMSMDYPLVVHNQLIPDKYHGKKTVAGWIPDPYNQGTLYADRTTTIFTQMILDKTLRSHKLMDGVRWPAWDDWIPSYVPANTSSVYVAMIAVDELNPTDVADLSQLEGVSIDGDIFQYMASCGQNLGIINMSAIHIGLFKGKQWMGDDAITVSADLKVTTTAPMCARDQYHLRIAVLNDLVLLPSQVRYNLRIHGKAAQKILKTLQDTMRFANYVPKLQGPGIMPDQYLVESAWRINTHKRPYQTPLECRMLTVGNFLVAAKRMSEYAPDAPSGPAPAPAPLNQDPNYEPLVSGDCERHERKPC
jgi:hypothetical protein